MYTFRGLLRCFMVLLLASGALMYAQGVGGNITGQVLDSSGAAVPNAKITATNVDTNIVTATTSGVSGNYNLVVYPGPYQVVTEAPGFKKNVVDKVVVNAQATVRIDPLLEVGMMTESVEVSGTLLTVQTENARVSTSVENKLVDELPLVVGGSLRNPYDLAQVAAQVTKSGTSDISFGGASARAWNATLDGLAITPNRSLEDEVSYMAPSLEALTEMVVDTGGFKAEYGQAAGGVLTFSSKSGTNDFHGTAFEFLRNEALDARRFFEPKKSVYKQHDFGIAGGGPVWIPHIYDGHNRTFFYATYEGFRNRVGANDTILSVPTPEMYTGDFSNWVNSKNQLIVIYDPATTRANPSGGGFLRDPFVGNKISPVRFSALSKLLVPYGSVVGPNRGGALGTYAYVNNNYSTSQGTTTGPQNKVSVKIDHAVNSSHRLGFFTNITRYNLKLGVNGGPGLPLPLYNSEVQSYNSNSYRVTYDWIISSRTFNHLQFGTNSYDKASYSPNYSNTPNNWKTKLCMAGAYDCNRNFPQVSFSEFSSWGAAALNGTQQPTVALKDDISYTVNKHALKWGFTYQHQNSVGYGEQTIAGSASFSYLGTSAPAASSFTSGSSFASFLLGNVNSGGTATPRWIQQIYPYFGWYLQDDWRVSNRLTLNLGLRYDVTLPPREHDDNYSDFTPTKPNPAANNYPGAMRFAGFGEGRENVRSLVPGWFRGIGPRFGMAFSLNQKTTMRFAAGQSFSRVTVSRGSGHADGFFGSWSWSSNDSGITPAFNWDAGMPAYTLPKSVNPSATLDPSVSNNQGVNYWQPQDAARPSESLYANFNIQRQVANNTVVDIGYSANIGTHLMSSLLVLNQVPTAIWNSYVQTYGVTAARTLMLSDINSTTARAANVPIPYANFTDPSKQTIRTVAQALRPYPQYQAISTGDADKSGHSAYHSLVVKVSRRFYSGLAFDWNYVLSKLLGDSDSFVGSGGAQDQYNRSLEKSLSKFDQTHSLKMSTVFELPFGKGRRFLRSGIGDALFGGWRVSAIQSYASGFPIAVTRGTNPLPISNGGTRPTITTYDGWRAAFKGDSFDPATDRFIDVNAFPTQPTAFGNATRTNGKLRSFPNFNENVSLAKRFTTKERYQLDVRWEAFNLFNRVQFSTGSLNLSNTSTFGLVTSQENEPRRMQLGLKLYW